MYETDSVDAQEKILTDNFLRGLDSCAPFETKLINKPPARWITVAIKNDIKKKNIRNNIGR